MPVSGENDALKESEGGRVGRLYGRYSVESRTHVVHTHCASVHTWAFARIIGSVTAITSMMTCHLWRAAAAFLTALASCLQHLPSAASLVPTRMLRIGVSIAYPRLPRREHVDIGYEHALACRCRGCGTASIASGGVFVPFCATRRTQLTYRLPGTDTGA